MVRNCLEYILMMLYYFTYNKSNIHCLYALQHVSCVKRCANHLSFIYRHTGELDKLQSVTGLKCILIMLHYFRQNKFDLSYLGSQQHLSHRKWCIKHLVFVYLFASLQGDTNEIRRIVILAK